MGLALDKCCCTNEPSGGRYRSGQYEDYLNTPDLSRASAPIKQAGSNLGWGSSTSNQLSQSNLSSVASTNHKNQRESQQAKRKDKALVG